MKEIKKITMSYKMLGAIAITLLFFYNCTPSLNKTASYTIVSEHYPNQDSARVYTVCVKDTTFSSLEEYAELILATRNEYAIVYFFNDSKNTPNVNPDGTLPFGSFKNILAVFVKRDSKITGERWRFKK